MLLTDDTLVKYADKGQTKLEQIHNNMETYSILIMVSNLITIHIKKQKSCLKNNSKKVKLLILIN